MIASTNLDLTIVKPRWEYGKVLSELATWSPAERDAFRKRMQEAVDVVLDEDQFWPTGKILSFGCSEAGRIRSILVKWDGVYVLPVGDKPRWRICDPFTFYVEVLIHLRSRTLKSPREGFMLPDPSKKDHLRFFVGDPEKVRPGRKLKEGNYFFNFSRRSAMKVMEELLPVYGHLSLSRVPGRSNNTYQIMVISARQPDRPTSLTSNFTVQAGENPQELLRNRVGNFLASKADWEQS